MTRTGCRTALAAFALMTAVAVAPASAHAPDLANSLAQKDGKDSKVELEGTYWRATSIAGKAVPAADKNEAHIVFSNEKGGVSGSTGCNRFAGTASRDGNTLSFKPLATTRMMCPE